MTVPTVNDRDRKRQSDIADYAKRVVDEAPPLTAAQRDRLAVLLAQEPTVPNRRSA